MRRLMLGAVLCACSVASAAPARSQDDARRLTVLPVPPLLTLSAAPLAAPSEPLPWSPLLSVAAAPAAANAPADTVAEAARAAARPVVAVTPSRPRLRDSLVAFARAQLGRRYVWGGESPERGFDCSGLTRYIMARLKVQIPRTARAQARAGAPLVRDRTALQPGDLLMFGFGRTSHVGIYVGDGRFIHASSAAGRVVESRLDRKVVGKVKPWLGARRVLDDGTEIAARSGGAEAPHELRAGS